ncbi:MAG TPA: PIN domain-containing protein [Steroidobacteraceae bacterium]|nr:PIN domain-containing protein [Steroidobacteraceae bacterium]
MSSATYKHILFVDYENRDLELNAVPPDVLVRFFFGASQKKVSTEFFRAARQLGEHFVDIDIEGQTKNALDFHIAFYLGECLASNPNASCFILSGDTGFDPLVKHLGKRGFAVRRVSSITEAFGSAKQKISKPKASESHKPNGHGSLSYEEVVAWLKKLDKKGRPGKRKTLIAHIKATFKGSSEGELNGVVDGLIEEKRISEVGGRWSTPYDRNR